MITLTDNALLHLRKLIKEHNKKYVRLQVKGGGCAGFEYEWSFEDNDTRNDVVVDNILLIDRINELYLTGMELDYKQEIFGANFVFNNPMAKSSCVVVHHSLSRTLKLYISVFRPPEEAPGTLGQTFLQF